MTTKQARYIPYSSVLISLYLFCDVLFNRLYFAVYKLLKYRSENKIALSCLRYENHASNILNMRLPWNFDLHLFKSSVARDEVYSIQCELYH